MKGWKGRTEMAVRQWRLLVLLRRKPHSLTLLSRELGVCERTVRRDLQALQSVPFPIVRADHAHDSTWWTLDTMPEWPKGETTPVQEIRA